MAPALPGRAPGGPACPDAQHAVVRGIGASRKAHRRECRHSLLRRTGPPLPHPGDGRPRIQRGALTQERLRQPRGHKHPRRNRRGSSVPPAPLRVSALQAALPLPGRRGGVFPRWLGRPGQRAPSRPQQRCLACARGGAKRTVRRRSSPQQQRWQGRRRLPWRRQCCWPQRQAPSGRIADCSAHARPLPHWPSPGRRGAHGCDPGTSCPGSSIGLAVCLADITARSAPHDPPGTCRRPPRRTRARGGVSFRR